MHVLREKHGWGCLSVVLTIYDVATQYIVIFVCFSFHLSRVPYSILRAVLRSASAGAPLRETVQRAHPDMFAHGGRARTAGDCRARRRVATTAGERTESGTDRDTKRRAYGRTFPTHSPTRDRVLPPGLSRPSPRTRGTSPVW